MNCHRPSPDAAEVAQRLREHLRKILRNLSEENTVRIHIADLEREIAKAARERNALLGEQAEIEKALEARQGTRWLLLERARHIDADLDEMERYLEMITDPDILEPCSSVARAAGCTCTLVSPTDIDPPEAIRSRSCPLHGSEPEEAP